MCISDIKGPTIILEQIWNKNINYFCNTISIYLKIEDKNNRVDKVFLTHTNNHPRSVAHDEMYVLKVVLFRVS